MNGHLREYLQRFSGLRPVKGHCESRPSFGPPVGIQEVVLLLDLIRGWWQQRERSCVRASERSDPESMKHVERRAQCRV